MGMSTTAQLAIEWTLRGALPGYDSPDFNCLDDQGLELSAMQRSSQMQGCIEGMAMRPIMVLHVL